nr:immunoglobulin heavy chain junction region [Mus musculus]
YYCAVYYYGSSYN